MTVLVIGATGTVGPHVVSALLEQGARVRVLVRDGDRATALLGPDVEVVAGTASDPAAVGLAADGVDSLLLLTPHGDGMADLQLRVLRRVRRQALRIVKLSGTDATIRPDGSDGGRQHWEVERVLSGGDQPFVILRSNSFLQSFVGPGVLIPVRSTGTLPNPLGDAGVSAVDARDVGQVAARALTSSRFDGRTLVLTGPRAVTMRDLGALLSEQLGRHVAVVDQTIDTLRASLGGRGMSEWQVEHVIQVQQMLRAGGSASVTGTVEEVLGRPAGDIAEHLRSVLRPAASAERVIERSQIA